ncbi:unnamed protein product, partial [Choristocarpus tenellus]
DQVNNRSDNGNVDDTTQGPSSLEKCVENFNSWVDGHRFPDRRVRAQVVGDGMRIGAVATEDIKAGEAYLSVPPEIIMD